MITSLATIAQQAQYAVAQGIVLDTARPYPPETPAAESFAQAYADAQTQAQQPRCEATA